MAKAPKEPKQVVKIEYHQLLENLANPHYSEAKLLDYITIDSKHRIGMAPALLPNEYVTFVDNKSVEARARGSFFLGILNSHYRSRRLALFNERIANKFAKPIIMAEGDSWFQYPIKLKDVIDWLVKDYNVYCTSGAGDELRDIAKKIEFVDLWKNLTRHRKLDVKALLFSAGGNDIAAKHFPNLILKYQNGLPAKSSLHPTNWLAKKKEITAGYQQLIDAIRLQQKVDDDDLLNPKIPILIHGYDYANPLPKQPFSVWPLDGWLGEPMRQRGYPDGQIQKDLVHEIIEQMNTDLARLATVNRGVHFIDNRNLVKNRWFDELHPKDSGFRDVAKKFQAQLVVLGIQ